MRVFQQRLAEVSRASTTSRTFAYLPYDQLTTEVGPLSGLPPNERGIILVESREKPERRPYHAQKLALLLANQRQFALEQAAQGAEVRLIVADSFAAALEPLVAQLGPLQMMEAAERELRVELAPLVAAKKLKLLRFIALSARRPAG